MRDWEYFICYESVFPDEVRLFAANGAQVLVNISNDGGMATAARGRSTYSRRGMRAVENNRWFCGYEHRKDGGD